MILELCYYANPILRKRALPIKKVTDEIREFANDMIETMDEYKGIGLAANQVGKAIRMFVVRKEKTLPDGKMGVGDAKVYINPVLSEPGEEHDTLLEGCLSFPGIQVEVERPLAITVEALDLEGNKFKEVITGYDARVIMHENDHLNGTFFIDRCSKEEKQRVEEEVRQVKKKYKETYS